MNGEWSCVMCLHVGLWFVCKAFVRLAQEVFDASRLHRQAFARAEISHVFMPALCGFCMPALAPALGRCSKRLLLGKHWWKKEYLGAYL